MSKIDISTKSSNIVTTLVIFHVLMERVYDTSRANGEEQFDCLLHCLAWWGKDSWEEREFLLCRLVPENSEQLMLLMSSWLNATQHWTIFCWPFPSTCLVSRLSLLRTHRINVLFEGFMGYFILRTSFQLSLVIPYRLTNRSTFMCKKSCKHTHKTYWGEDDEN